MRSCLPSGWSGSNHDLIIQVKMDRLADSKRSKSAGAGMRTFGGGQQSNVKSFGAVSGRSGAPSPASSSSWGGGSGGGSGGAPKMFPSASWAPGGGGGNSGGRSSWAPGGGGGGGGWG